jgi:hypothetical protein
MTVRGARDLTLGIGALHALRCAGAQRAWFAAHAPADGVDLAAMLSARTALQRNLVFAVAMGGASHRDCDRRRRVGLGPAARRPQAAEMNVRGTA